MVNIEQTTNCISATVILWAIEHGYIVKPIDADAGTDLASRLMATLKETLGDQARRASYAADATPGERRKPATDEDSLRQAFEQWLTRHPDVAMSYAAYIEFVDMVTEMLTVGMPATYRVGSTISTTQTVAEQREPFPPLPTPGSFTVDHPIAWSMAFDSEGPKMTAEASKDWNSSIVASAEIRENAVGQWSGWISDPDFATIDEIIDLDITMFHALAWATLGLLQWRKEI